MLNIKPATFPAQLAASRRAAVAPFLAMDVLNSATELERGGAHIIHMEIGEPGAPTPRPIREAAIKALQNDRISYTPALGRPQLRQRIARHYRETYGLAVAPERIAVTTGSSAGFVLAFLALFDIGARVAVAAPGYPAYANIFSALGIEVVPLETQACDRYVVTAQAIAQSHAAKPLDGVLLMSPSNPSGTMMSVAVLGEICATCQQLGIKFVSDEIYHGLTYDRPAESALRFMDECVVVNSFSKYFCMTGWRIGWLVLPPALVRPVERLAQSLAISPPMLSQVAAEAAFDARDELEAIKHGYARNRDMLMQDLPGIGLGDFHPVDGAFYVYADIGRLTNDSADFCARLLKEGGVAATPGLDFEAGRGNRMMRLSFAGSESDVREGLARMKAWLG